MSTSSTDSSKVYCKDCKFYRAKYMRRCVLKKRVRKVNPVTGEVTNEKEFPEVARMYMEEVRDRQRENDKWSQLMYADAYEVLNHDNHCPFYKPTLIMRLIELIKILYSKMQEK